MIVSHETIEIRPDGDAGDGDELNPVLGDGGDRRRFDDLRNHRHLHGFEDVTARQVDRCRTAKRHCDVGLVRRDERIHDPDDVTAGQIVRFELVDRHTLQPSLHRTDMSVDNGGGRHTPEAHADQREQPDIRSR
jgi:hypothetical protein